MGEWDLSGSESHVEWWDIKEEGNQSELGEETEITHAVDHLLLVKGEVSGLAGDHSGGLNCDN